MSADAHAHAERDPHLAHHFQDMATQRHAATLGMWLFLGTEILLFGGLFCAYSAYRNLFHHAWKECSHHLNRPFGLIETFDLIISSFFMAMSIHLNRVGKRNLSALCLILTISMGFAFLGLHSFEYYTEYMEGALPGKYFHFEEVTAPGAPMFYAVYFLMTGLHSAHVAIGAGLLIWMLIKTIRKQLTPTYDTPLELCGLYWHLVDLIWIFLFPLLYLV
jgi:cytochrome c oxidase subunit 3